MPRRHVAPAILALVGSVVLAIVVVAAPSGPGVPLDRGGSGAAPTGDGGSGAVLASPVPTPAPSSSSAPAPVALQGVRWPSLTPSLERRLQKALARHRRAAGIPGVSVTMIFPDGRRWTGVAGIADVASGRRVTPDTAFSIASASKTFLAALILELAAEGRFALDAPAADHLPELDLRLNPRITIRMLLDHTSGLPDYFLHPRIDRALLRDRSRTWTPDDSLRYVGASWFAPGTDWRYSNTNYLLLQLLAEHVTGRPLAEQLRSRYLDPLRLRSVTYQGAEPARAPLAAGHRLTGSGRRAEATGVGDGSGIVPFTSVVTAAGGAGSLVATSGDLASWARSLYGGEVLDRLSLARMLDGVERVAAYRPRTPYGLGVQAVLVDRFPSYGHSGRFLGFRGVMRYLPNEDIAAAILTNQNRVDPAPILADLVRIVTAVSPHCRGCPIPG